MLDQKELEKMALQHLLESNSQLRAKKTFQEKFNRFDETKLLNWEEDQSESSLILLKEKKENNAIFPKRTPMKKQQLNRLESIPTSSKNTLKSYPQRVLQTESDIITPKTQFKTRLDFRPLKLGNKEEKTNFNQTSLISLEKHQLPSPEINFNQEKMMNKSQFKILKQAQKKPLQLKLVSPANKSSNMVFLNDFNDHMLRNRQNFSPSNFTLLNLENNLINKNSFPGNYCKHIKVKSLGKNNIVTNVGNRFAITNVLGMIENRNLKDTHEKEKVFKVLHSLHSMRFFNFS